MDNIEISFIIPVYNCAQYIEEAVFSIVNLGLENYEIIIVDDGSTDNSSNVVRSLNLEQIRLFEGPQRGVSAARNLGIRNAKGEYISFMDADDECIKKSFKTAFNIIKNYETLEGVYIGLPELCDKTMVSFKKQPKLKRKIENKIYSLFASEIFATVQSLIVKKDVFAKIGLFDESLEIGEDFDLYLRLFDSCKIEVITDCFGFKYRQTPTSLMNSPKNDDKLVSATEFIISKIKSYDFKDKKLNKKRENLATLKFLDLISAVAKNGNKSMARKLLGDFWFYSPKINFKILKRVAKIVTII